MDREVVSTLIALDAPSIRARTAVRFDAGEGTLDLEGLDADADLMSSGERALIDLAVCCWTGAGLIDLGYWHSFGDEFARRALTALAARLGLLDNGPLTLNLLPYLGAEVES